MDDEMKMNDSCNSSQDSLLMSQETLDNLYEFIGNLGDLRQFGVDDANNAMSIDFPTPVGHDNAIRSSLPATENWPGRFGFSLSFAGEDTTKSTNWTYSETANKLYIRKHVPCPFMFNTNHPLPFGTIIRAVAVFTSPEHASEAVVRCVNHSKQEILDGNFNAEHLVRTDHEGAVYQEDAHNKALSVVLPFIGPGCFTFVYNFACFNSCSGGPNRRALTLVFTLESGNEVIGRCSLDLKVCSSPKRDRELDENGPPASSSKSSFVAKKMDVTESKSKTKGDSASKLKEAAEREFIIRVKNEKLYKYLKEMEKLFMMGKIMKYKHLISSSSDEATDSCYES